MVTDADWADDVKDRRSYSGIAVWAKGTVEDTWYIEYTSSKKQHMVCVSSGESELMALARWADAQLELLFLCTDGSAALGFV